MYSLPITNCSTSSSTYIHTPLIPKESSRRRSIILINYPSGTNTSSERTNSRHRVVVVPAASKSQERRIPDRRQKDRKIKIEASAKSPAARQPPCEEKVTKKKSNLRRGHDDEDDAQSRPARGIPSSPCRTGFATYPSSFLLALKSLRRCRVSFFCRTRADRENRLCSDEIGATRRLMSLLSERASERLIVLCKCESACALKSLAFLSRRERIQQKRSRLLSL